MKKITITSSGSLGPAKTIIRDEISWIRSAYAESKVFNFSKTEIFAAACGSSHSLYKYAKFRSELINAPFVDDRSQESKKDKSFSTKKFVHSISNSCPSVIYTIPNILRVICLVLNKNNKQKIFEKVKLILSGGEEWIFGLETLVKSVFPNAKIVEFYGAAELGFVGWGEPGRGFNLFPDVNAWCDSSNKIWVDSPYIANIESPASAGDSGWFDKKGLLHLTGRSDRNFSIKGLKISSKKIEELLQSVTQINNSYVFKKKYKSREGQIAIIIYIGNFKNSKNSHSDSLKLLPLTDSIKKIIQALLAEKKIYIPISSFKKINVWPLLDSGKTNFKILENLW